MELTINGLIGRHINATDGKTGKVKEFYFDDCSWKIRYLAVKTGNWLAGSKVFISPDALAKDFRITGTFPVHLTKEQVRNSPAIDTGKRSTDGQHLRSTLRITGFRMHSQEGDMGHINDFVLDDQTWQIIYMVLDTHSWLGGKKVLVEVGHIKEIQWENSKVLADLTFDTIINSRLVRRRIESARGRMDLLYLLS